ncbi:MAG: 30S ribosome-binding factor RbfA [Anaerolineae bacterium]|nr:30S ribosome-binding factor RbfA [Anaerolineae bacterium]
MPYRRERGNSFIKEELTLLLRNAVRDPRVAPLTITDVELTPDRRIARVYVACYEGEEALQEGLKGLESAKGFLRREIGRVLRWRFTPELEFRVDRSWEYGAKIDALLEKIRQEGKWPSDEEDEQQEEQQTG